jgi:hypothetical protein
VPGDRMRVKADGAGRVVFERIEERAVPASQCVSRIRRPAPRAAPSSAR